MSTKGDTATFLTLLTIFSSNHLYQNKDCPHQGLCIKDGPSLPARKVDPKRGFTCITTEVRRGPAAINPGFKLLPFIFNHEIFIQKFFSQLIMVAAASFHHCKI